MKVALIAAATAIIAAFIAGFYTLLSPITSAIVRPGSSDANVELVDVSVRDSGGTSQLDIKVRNTGEEIALIKEADLGVKKTWELRAGGKATGYVPSSHNYDVRSSTSDAPYTKTASLSQGIEPNDVSRFTITLSTRVPEVEVGYVFLMTLELVSNEDDEIASRNLLFVPYVPWPMEEQISEMQKGKKLKVFRPRTGRFQLEEIYSQAALTHNERVADEISGIEGVKSRRLERLIRHFKVEPSK
jgi:hypothetical protein